jgi:FHA domain
MTTYPCPQGHPSIDPDYCSQCGSKIAVLLEDGTNTAEIAPSLPASESCPVCTVPRTAGNFCEACGYNYLTGKPAELPADAKLNDGKPNDGKLWQIAIAINDLPPTTDVPVPPSRPTQIIDLNIGSYLIGRTSQKRAILPEIPLDFDDAVSHRHAILEMRADRSLILRDIGSANGTSLNGHEIPLTRDIPLQDGDTVTLGHWTKITIFKK